MRSLIAGDRIEVRGLVPSWLRTTTAIQEGTRKTGEQITVKSKHLPFFKTGKELKEKTNA
jgi:integration host factor subunit beta